MTGHGDCEWYEEIKLQLNYLPKDLGFEDNKKDIKLK